MIMPSTLVKKVQDKYNATQTAHQTQEDNLCSFLQQTENRLRELQKKLQDFAQKQQEFTIKLDQTFQALEQEIGKNSGFIASLSPNNALAKKEQVGQKRVSLLQRLKQLEGNLSQLDQELITIINEAGQSFQQVQKTSEPVRQSMQDLLDEISNLDREIKNFESQTQANVPTNAQPVSVPNNQVAQEIDVLIKLGQAETALMALRQALGKNRLMYQVMYNINDFGHRYNLQ